MTIPSAENEDRIRALMAQYENVMSGDGGETRCASSDTLTNEAIQDLGVLQSLTFRGG